MSDRKIGDRVFVNADNYGETAVIIEVRESTGSPSSHYKVRTASGQEFWAFDFELTTDTWEKEDAPYG